MCIYSQAEQAGLSFTCVSNMYVVCLFNMLFTKFLLIQILEILMVTSYCKQDIYLIIRFF